MAKKSNGKKIDELFIGIGLDLTELDKDFIDAGGTVSSELSKLQRLTAQTKLKTDIKLTGIDSATNSAEALQVKLKGLSEQLKIQEQTLKIVTAAYQDTAKANGANSAIAQNAENRLLREKKLYEELSRSIKDVSKSMGEADSVSKLQRLKNMAEKQQLKTDIKLTGIDSAVNSTEALEIKLKGLSNQLKLQEQTVKTVNEAYLETVKRQGAKSADAQNAENRLLREKKLYEELGRSIKDVSKSINDIDNAKSTEAINLKLQRLKNMAEKQQLKTDIKLTGIDSATNSAEALQVKLKGLNKQLRIQEQTVKTVDVAYQEMVKAHGANSAVAQSAENRLLREKKLYEEIRKNIKNIKLEQNTDPVNKLSDGFNKLKNTTGSIGDNILGINRNIIAIGATIAAGGGLFNLVKGAVDAGDSAWRLANRLNLTAQEAGNLNRILSVTGVEGSSFITTMIRLDKSVSNAGESGNNITKAMDLFGISLKDANGSLLPMNKQLEQLAIGYQNAARAGEQDAYVAQVLGARGAELVPLLQEYTIAAKAAGEIKTIGINPDEAHELAIKMKMINMQAGQMKNALGDALMPLAEEYAPRALSVLQEMVVTLKENKNEIKENIDSVAGLTGDIVDLGVQTGKALKEWFPNLTSLDFWRQGVQDLTDDIRVLTEHTSIALGSIVLPTLRTDAFQNQYKAERTALEMEAKAKAVLRQKELREKIEAEKKLEEENKKALAEKRQDIQTEQELLKAKQEIEAEIYKSSHSNYENQLYDIEQNRLKMIESIGNVEAANKVAEFKKAAAAKKHNKEIEDNTKQLNDELYRITHSSTEARIKEIEKEREEWIKKTNDEVKATQLAEEKKRQAINQSFIDTIKNKKAQIEAVARYEESLKNIEKTKVIDGKGQDISQQVKENQRKAAAEALKEELSSIKIKELGIKKEDLQIPVSLAIKAENIDKYISDNLLNLKSIDIAARLNESRNDIAQAGIESANQYFEPFKKQTEVIAQNLAMVGNSASNKANSNSSNELKINVAGINIEFKGFTSEEVNSAIEKAKDTFGNELRQAFDDAKAQYSV